MSFLERAKEVFGDEQVSSLLQDLRQIERRIQIAGELCKEVGDPPGLFKALQATDVLAGLDTLYEPHARELTDRAKAGQDLRPGTKAEVLAALMAVSLKTPLTSSGLALAEKLFRECTAIDLGADLGHEDYQGQLEEQLTTARHALRQETRKI